VVVNLERIKMIPRSDDSKFGLYFIVPIIMASLFAQPIGDAVLRMFGVATTGVASFFATAIAGAVIGVAAVFVWIRLSRK
jgi:hypothetical protein